MAERRCPACGGPLEPGNDTIAPNMWGCSACNLQQREAPVGELAVMTRNDPYESGSVRVPWFQVFKRVWGTLVRLLARYSDNRILVGPSLQAFARRPTK